MYFSLFSLTFSSGDDPSSEREHLLHLKFIVTFFVRNTALLRTNHSEHHEGSFCLFFPLSMQRRKNVKAWHLTTVMCRCLRRGRQTTSPFWKEKEAEDLLGWGWTLQRWGRQSGLEDIYWPWACSWLLAAMLSAPQLCPTACFAHMPWPRLRDSGRCSLTLYPSSSPIMGSTLTKYSSENDFSMSLDLSQREDSSGKLAASRHGKSLCPNGRTSEGALTGYSIFPNTELAQ